MLRIIFNLIVVMFFFSMSALAGDEPFAIPAKPSDFIGIWKLLPLDAEMDPKALKENPWPAQCQYFGHYSNGIWLHQQTHLGACNNGIPDNAPNYPVNVTWKIERDGLVLINRPEYKIIEPWKVDKITKDMHLGTTNLNKGDLLMQLYNAPNKQGFVYVRLLRRIKQLK